LNDMIIKQHRWLQAAMGMAAAAGLAACATSPIPNEKIAVAKASIQHAEQAGAQQLAPVEMKTAQDKLQRAEAAAANHEAQPATVLAEQADIDAQVAEATAQQQRSHKAAVELNASLRDLSRETNRATSQETGAMAAPAAPPAGTPQTSGPQPMYPQQ
jgi:hypothetical protein